MRPHSSTTGSANAMLPSSDSATNQRHDSRLTPPPPQQIREDACEHERLDDESGGDKGSAEAEHYARNDYGRIASDTATARPGIATPRIS